MRVPNNIISYVDNLSSRPLLKQQFCVKLWEIDQRTKRNKKLVFNNVCTIISSCPLSMYVMISFLLLKITYPRFCVTNFKSLQRKNVHIWHNQFQVDVLFQAIIVLCMLGSLSINILAMHTTEASNVNRISW